MAAVTFLFFDLLDKMTLITRFYHFIIMCSVFMQILHITVDYLYEFAICYPYIIFSRWPPFSNCWQIMSHQSHVETQWLYKMFVLDAKESKKVIEKWIFSCFFFNGIRLSLYKYTTQNQLICWYVLNQHTHRKDLTKQNIWWITWQNKNLHSCC